MYLKTFIHLTSFLLQHFIHIITHHINVIIQANQVMIHPHPTFIMTMQPKKINNQNANYYDPELTLNQLHL